MTDNLQDLLVNPIIECAGDLISNLRTNLEQKPGEGFNISRDSFAEFPGIGLRRSARLPVLAALHTELQIPILLITDRTDHALSLHDELGILAPNAERLFFPEPGPLFYEDTPWGERTRRDRLLVLTQLAAHHLPGQHFRDSAPVIIAPAHAIITRTLTRREFLKSVRILKAHQEYPLERLIRLLSSRGYEPVNTVIAPGQFARRGGIIDLWPPSEFNPVRLDFFGDEIDSLRYFDPPTQRSANKIEQLLVSPAREFILPDETDGSDHEDNPYSEFHIPVLHTSPASLLDYLPRKALVLLDNHENIKDSINAIEVQAVERRAEQIGEKSLPEDFPIPYLTLGELQDSMSSHHTIELGSSVMVETTSFAQRFTSGPRFGGKLKPLLEHLSQHTRKSERMVIVSRQAARLQELW